MLWIHADGLTGGQQWVGNVGEDRLVGALVDHVDSQTVAGLHQSVQVLAAGVNLNPARVVTRVRSLEAIHQFQLTGLSILFVCPDLVGLQIGGVQVGLGGIEHHAVDTGVGLVLVVLNVDIEGAVGLNGENVSVSSVLIEGVAVDVVGRLVGGEDEDGTGVGVVAGSQGWCLE